MLKQVSVRVVLLLSCFFVFASCTAYLWHLSPSFPKEEKSWEIPLLYPLTQQMVYVPGEVSSPDQEGKTHSHTLDFLVDSGASSNGLGSKIIKSMGLKVKKHDQVTVSGAGGGKRAWSGSLIRKFRLGNLELDDVAFLKGGELSHIVGNNILKEYPWEVDFDRGVLIINAKPWEERAEIKKIKLWNPYQYGIEAVKAKIGKKKVFLVLDTGASTTSLDKKMAQDIGMKKIILKKEDHEAYRTAYKRITVREHYSTDNFFIDGQSMGSQVFRPLIDHQEGPGFNMKVAGLLGMNFLSKYRFRIETGDEIKLRPRSSTLATSAERCARWDWVPTCADTIGCATAQISSGEKESFSYSITFDKKYDRPSEFVFACVDKNEKLNQDYPLIQFDVVKPNTGKLEITKFPKRLEPETLARIARLFSKECSLRLVDINPLLHEAASTRGHNTVHVYKAANTN